MVLKGKMSEEIRILVIIESERLDCQIVEMNIQVDYVYFLIKAAPKVSLSSLMGGMKGNQKLECSVSFQSWSSVLI
jgi:putative transposase